MSKTVQLPEGTPPYKKANLKSIESFEVEVGFNRRQDFNITDEEVQRFRRSYEKDPFAIAPLTGYYDASKGKVILTDGERRLRMAQAAGIPSLPFIQTSNNMLERLESQATNNSGKPFTDVENKNLANALADAFRAENPDAKKSQVRDYVMGVMNISQPTWYNYQKINEAPQDVQDLVDEGKVSMTLVREIMTETNLPEEVSALVQKEVQNIEAAPAAETTASTSSEQKGKAPAAKPGKRGRKPEEGKATRATRKTKKKEETPFEKQSYGRKLSQVVAELQNSEAPAAKLFLQIDEALHSETQSLQDIVALIVQAQIEATPQAQ